MTSPEAAVELLRRGDLERVEALLRAEPDLVDARQNGVSLLLWTLYLGQPRLTEAFVRRRVSLDFFEAAALGRLERLEELLRAEPSLAKAHAPDGFSALGLAAFFQRPEAVRLLIQRGAEVNAPSRNALQVTPLHSAVARRSHESIRWLLAAGADVNARQQGGLTPLHGAAFEGDLELARLLVQRGADVNARDDREQTPLDLARQRGHAELIAWFEAGARAS